jgi:formate hydrogenlyase subunit 4
MYIFSMIGVSSSMAPSETQGNTLEVEGKMLELKMASHDLSTTTLISLGVSLMLSKWRHSSSSHIVESLVSHIVESLISHIVESLISMAMASSMSE